jgi:peptidoglycan hydrolase-like protein with peptidoglycan-binding domain
MRLTHLALTGVTAFSLATFALAADEAKQGAQQQGSAQTEQSAQTSQGSAAAGASAQGGSAMTQNEQVVRQVQEKLKSAGHDIQVDGVWGPNTQAALREYQQKQGHQPTGELDEQTLSALGVEAEGAAATGGSSGSGTSQPSSGAAGGATQTPSRNIEEKSKY